MDTILTGIEQAAAAMSLWEIIAVALGVAYLLLAMKQNILCWYAAFFSTAIFIWLFWDVSLVMDSALKRREKRKDKIEITNNNKENRNISEGNHS